ncbi:MAG: META domain-containing protein [Methanoregula sp.]|nr:META domain-containing protein [Methanoregula sp.]
MKKTTQIFLFLAVISTILIAGCTQVQTLPAPAPAATAVPTYVQNQQGVAIIKTVTATPTPIPTTAVTVATTAPPLTDPALTGTWNYNGAMLASGGSGKIPVISNTKGITLTFNNDGTLSGFSGCNNFNGGYTLSGKTTDFGKGISIGPLASTKMYCADTADFETAYLNNLQQTLTYSITNNKLMLRTSYASQLLYDKA